MALLLHYGVGVENQAILTIETQGGRRETLEVSAADLANIKNLQAANPPPPFDTGTLRPSFFAGGSFPINEAKIEIFEI